LNCCAIRTKKIKNFDPSDLEVDKTYNIGTFWVTNTSIKVPWLEVKQRKGKVGNDKWSPVIPGPVFIHYESTELTYSTIFMSLNQILRTPKLPFSIRFAITTDGELAMINAAKNNVLGCIHSLCHRHLRANVKQNLKPGLEELEADILACMFDKPNALCVTDNEREFNEKKLDIDANAFKTPTYYDEMCDKIWNMVILPRKAANGAIGLKNTTNGVGKIFSK